MSTIISAWGKSLATMRMWNGSIGWLYGKQVVGLGTVVPVPSQYWPLNTTTDSIGGAQLAIPSNQRFAIVSEPGPFLSASLKLRVGTYYPNVGQAAFPSPTLSSLALTFFAKGPLSMSLYSGYTEELLPLVYFAYGDAAYEWKRYFVFWSAETQGAAAVASVWRDNTNITSSVWRRQPTEYTSLILYSVGSASHSIGEMAVWFNPGWSLANANDIRATLNDPAGEMILRGGIWQRVLTDY